MKQEKKEQGMLSKKMVTLDKFAPKDSTKKADGMYDPAFEHDNCGIGSVVNIKGIKTHETVENALKIVENLKHRAGKDAEGKTGDGVGILLQISHKFFSKATKQLGIELGSERDYGIGMFFFPQDELKRNQAKKMFEVIVQKEGMEFLGWREVPTDPTKLGQKAVGCMPYIMQGFVKRPKNVDEFNQIVQALLTSNLDCRMIDFFRTSRVSFRLPEDTVWTLDGERAECGSKVELQVLHNAVKLKK